jgi:tetratricopeptide (TPR) repeat protein
MKKSVYRLYGILAVGIIFTCAAFAQTGAVSGTKYGIGEDSVMCLRNLSLFQQDYRQNNYESAIENWRKVMRDCPRSSANNIPRGITMYQYFISRELDVNKKKAFVDTLMQVYQKGIEMYPANTGRYLDIMVEDLLKYDPDDKGKILQTIEKSMQIQKEKTPPRTYANYMSLTMELYGESKISDEELIDNYNKVSDLIAEAIKRTPTEDLAKARNMIDDSFAQSPAANCENLVAIYSTKYDSSKDDLEFLRKLTRMLNRKDCTDSDLFEKASEQQFALSPSSEAAYNMAKLFYRKDNYEKTIEYFQNAIQHETDAIEKASYYNQLGNILLAKMNNYAEAKKCALEASKLRPDWGEPYILLANIYIAGPKCGADDFEKGYIYWVAADKLQKAKAVDPDVAGKVNPILNNITPHYPKKEEAFFRNITEGNAVTVGCWVNESTKARFN